MRVLFVCQYYWPEEQNYFVHELATNILKRGHEVSVLTAFPHYGSAGVYREYRGSLSMKQTHDGVEIFRTFVYASGSKRIFTRIINFGSFCLSSFPRGLQLPRYDVLYVWLPPLPLGITGCVLAKLKRSKLVLHVQDIYPRAAIEHDIIRNRVLIRFLEEVEKLIYKCADFLIVISEGFQKDLVTKGIHPSKIGIVENWAAPEFFQEGCKENEFRTKVNPSGKFLVIYSGGINRNANLVPLVEAADLLRKEPFVFVVIGEGEFKAKLEQMVSERRLRNVQFLPLQPLSRYPKVLGAADINVVSLDRRSTFSSVPSKVYKQMAAGRPILAITPEENELHRLINSAKCGFCVTPEDPVGIAGVLRWCQSNPGDLVWRGLNGKRYLNENHSLCVTVDKVNRMLNGVMRM